MKVKWEHSYWFGGGGVEAGGGRHDLGGVVPRLERHHAGHDHEEAARAEHHRPREGDVGQPEPGRVLG